MQASRKPLYDKRYGLLTNSAVTKIASLFVINQG